MDRWNSRSDIQPGFEIDRLHHKFGDVDAHTPERELRSQAQVYSNYSGVLVIGTVSLHASKSCLPTFPRLIVFVIYSSSIPAY